MELANKISTILKEIQERNKFSDQQLADYVGVSRWTIYRIRRGEMGETVSSNLVDAILREQPRHAEQVAA